MPLTSFAVAFSLSRGPSQPEPAPKPIPVATAPNHSNGSVRGFSEAFRLGKAADQSPASVAPRPNEDDSAPSRLIVPDWLAESVKLRTHGGSGALTGPPAPKTEQPSEPSPGGDAHGPASEFAEGEPAAPVRPREVARVSRESKAEVDHHAQTPPAPQPLAAPQVSPQGVAPSPAETPGARGSGQLATPPNPTLWAIRTSDGLAYQGPDKAALEIWAAARNAELARAQTQWSYPASYSPWSGYGYGYSSGGCAGGSCR